MDDHIELEPIFLRDLRRQRLVGMAVSVVGSVVLGLFLGVIACGIVRHVLRSGINPWLPMVLALMAAPIAALTWYTNTGGRMSTVRAQRWTLRFFKTLALSDASPREVVEAAVQQSGMPHLARNLSLDWMFVDVRTNRFDAGILVLDDSSMHRPYARWRRRNPDATARGIFAHLHAQFMVTSPAYRRMKPFGLDRRGISAETRRAAEDVVGLRLFLEMLDFDIEPERGRFRHPLYVLQSLLGNEGMPATDGAKIEFPPSAWRDVARGREIEERVRRSLFWNEKRERAAVAAALVAEGLPASWPQDIDATFRRGTAVESPVAMNMPQALEFTCTMLYLLDGDPWDLRPRQGRVEMHDDRNNPVTIEWSLGENFFSVGRVGPAGSRGDSASPLVPSDAREKHSAAMHKMVASMHRLTWAEAPSVAIAVAGILLLPVLVLTFFALRADMVEYQRMNVRAFSISGVVILLVLVPAAISTFRQKNRWGSFLSEALIGGGGLLVVTYFGCISANWLGSFFDHRTLEATAWRAEGNHEYVCVQLDGPGQRVWEIIDPGNKSLLDATASGDKVRLRMHCRRGLLGVHLIESVEPIAFPADDADG